LAEADPAPPPGPGATYDIPAGNLFPPGTEGARPEIYIMGLRNPFSLNIDRSTGWLFWADVGPNATTPSTEKGPAGREEFDLATRAGNFGWPMFTGPNLPYPKYDYAAKKTGPVFDSLAPINDSKYNTGLKTLPRPTGSLVAYTRDGQPNPWGSFATGSEIVPIAGPVYRYDGSLPATYKLPPHFDGRWIVADYYMHWFKAIAFDAKGEKAVDVQPVFAGLDFSTVVDMKIGPDGALYVFENGTQAVSRIEYTGTCLPNVAIRAGNGTGLPSRPGAIIGRGRLAVPAGFAGFSLFDPEGKRIWSYRRERTSEPAIAALPAGAGTRLLFVRWEKAVSL
jgi:hypothetical protein